MTCRLTPDGRRKEISTAHFHTSSKHRIVNEKYAHSTSQKTLTPRTHGSSPSYPGANIGNVEASYARQEPDTMATDFIEKSNTKTSLRTLPVPFIDTTAFNSVVADIIEHNPFDCVSYEQAGETIPGVVRGREQYTSRIVYVNSDGARIGAASVTAQTISGMNAAATALMADAALTAAVGGTPIRDAGKDTYSCALKCHDENG
ncbi:MAG: hypothetical protein Q7J09_03975, partial [Methanocalculus sp.]|uniref:hypothetical protein n=1 Tax=Methanocalculus sp. TaxID=2004547 RepID=UPI00271D3371